MGAAPHKHPTRRTRYVTDRMRYTLCSANQMSKCNTTNLGRGLLGLHMHTLTLLRVKCRFLATDGNQFRPYSSTYIVCVGRYSELNMRLMFPRCLSHPARCCSLPPHVSSGDWPFSGRGKTDAGRRFSPLGVRSTCKKLPNIVIWGRRQLKFLPCL
ncbi:hypothetical protein BC834DRAFT_354756 [Gloeopeniophorella convolvens]|nr:hypothetical protein BC834DRAFT_354756 [Gloeopeniophorella convolvens]